MSRTYRFKKQSDSYLIKENLVLEICVVWPKYQIIDQRSDVGKLRLAQFHSDKKKRYYQWKGPSWFHNLYSQRPYRRKCKCEIARYLRDDEYEIQILDKPYRKYWN